MAIRYVKDFEFPSAAGYTDSAPSKVTGPMFAKGGKVEKAPKGMMVVIGIGKPKGKAPMEHKKGGKVDSVPVKDIKSGKIPQSTDEDFYGKAEDMPMPPRRPAGLKKGGMTHDDAAQDKAMIKSMVKPAALKKAMGGQAVQMAKSNAIEASMKGQKKTPYADGGNVMPPRIASPLQQMAARPRGVPVAPQAPMIPPQAAMAAPQGMPPRGAMGAMATPQAAAPGGARIGVGMRRPGQPDVGAIRAAMARKASQAMPENAPSMMKKGGKVKC